MLRFVEAVLEADFRAEARPSGGVDQMKKRELKYQLSQMRQRIEVLESQPRPKYCSECGVLFLPKLSGATAWVTVDMSSRAYKPDVCPHCKAKTEAA